MPQVECTLLQMIAAITIAYAPLNRATRERMITVQEHVRQILNVGVDATPHLAGIGSGKLVHARYLDMRLSARDMACITRAMRSPDCRLLKLNLSNSRLELEHVKTLCMCLYRLAEAGGGTLTALDLSHNEGVGYGGGCDATVGSPGGACAQMRV